VSGGYPQYEHKILTGKPQWKRSLGKHRHISDVIYSVYLKCSDKILGQVRHTKTKTKFISIYVRKQFFEVQPNNVLPHSIDVINTHILRLDARQLPMPTVFGRPLSTFLSNATGFEGCSERRQ
jgi:hypothetical protein